MSVHSLASSTLTVELQQVSEINAVLSPGAAGPVVTADLLGLAGATISWRVLDRAAAVLVPAPERRREDAVLPGGAVLWQLLATGAPTAPYLYGVFDETAGTGIAGGRRSALPVALHTGHLHRLSGVVGLPRHLWGV